MDKALRYLFWGYLFIFFQIHVMFDLLMDPIGYLLIFAGCAKLVDAYPSAKKAKTVALIGVFVSIPSVVVNLSDPALSSGWMAYAVLLSVLKLITAYYIFVALTDIVKEHGDRALQLRTKSTFSYYVGIHLIALALISFSMNMTQNAWAISTVAAAIAVVFMDIVFLLLIRAIRRATRKDHRVVYSM